MLSVSQRYEVLPVSQLELYPGNPRRGNLAAIGDSIAVNGFYGTILVQRSTNRIIIGNHRFRAALEAGATEVPCMVLDVDDAQAKTILLNENRLNEMGTFDEADLLAMLQSVDSLVGTGYDEAFMAKLAGPDLAPAATGKDDSELLATGFHVLVTCGSEDEQRLLLERFIGEGLAVKALVV